MKSLAVAAAFLLACFVPARAGTRAPFQPVSAPLLNIDFGTHLNPGFPRGSGPLAIGKGPGDVWNLYSRDGATMNDFVPDGSLTNLVWSDGTRLTGLLEVKNAAGAWATGEHHDPVFFSYLNPLGNDPDMRLELSSLPPGVYDLYFYAHAGIPEANSVVRVSTSSRHLGSKATSTAATWDSEFYTEGNHFVRFPDISLREGEKLAIVVQPGDHGRAYMNAMQLVLRDGAPPVLGDDRPSTNDLFDISRGTIVTAHSGLWSWGSYEIEAIFGSSNPGLEPGSTVFQDNQPDGFVHFVEWRTADPVLLASFRLFAGGDGPEYLNQREFGIFHLKAKTPGSETFDKLLYSYTPTHPYTFANPNTFMLIEAAIEPLIAQEFRAEFVQRNAGRSYDAPRIIELDGFGSMQTNRAVIVAEPRSTDVPTGGRADFEVGTRGAEPIFYQWFLNGAPLANGTNATLSITNAQSSDAGTYTVSVSNSEGSARSLGAVLNVLGDSNAGTVHFANYVADSIDAPVRDANGKLLAGADYLAQLYAGASQSTLRPIGAAVPFGIGGRAGYFEPGRRYVPGIEPGSPAVVEVRAWKTAAGPSFEQAAAAGGARGRSKPLAILLGPDSQPAPTLLGLAAFSLVEPPQITVPPPTNLTAVEGQAFTLQVEAAGGDLRYQWLFNDAPISNATQAIFRIDQASLSNAGSYSVEVRNDAGRVLSTTTAVTVREADRTPPVVTIVSPASGTTTAERVTITGTAADNVGVVRVELIRNTQLLGYLALESGEFTSASILLQPGTNSFLVRARDAAGNFGTAFLTIVQQGERAIYSTNLGDVQEGARVGMPVFLRSEGEVSAVTFTMLYPAANLAAPELIWATEPNGVLAQINTNITGQVRASFALPGASLPAGTQLLATVHFRVRSAPGRTLVTNRMQLQGIYGTDGNTLVRRTDVFGGSFTVVPRKYTGDNNANDRLDVGDASAVMRFVTLIEEPRPWDVPKNDLNANGELDAGDVIRVLRTVVGLDPQPGTGEARLSALSSSSSDLIVLRADKSQLVPGETVKVSVLVQGRSAPLSGACFRIGYPVEALRLDAAASVKSGALLPASAAALWNLSPAQNDFTLQDGSLRFAASSPASWPSTNGELLELAFTVREGSKTQSRWEIAVSNTDLSDGWHVTSLANSRLSLPVRGVAQLAATISGSELRLRCEGQPGSRYRIESSTDLRGWQAISGAIDLEASAGGTFESALPIQSGRQFFRAIQMN